MKKFIIIMFLVLGLACCCALGTQGMTKTESGSLPGSSRVLQNKVAREQAEKEQEAQNQEAQKQEALEQKAQNQEAQKQEALEQKAQNQEAQNQEAQKQEAPEQKAQKQDIQVQKLRNHDMSLTMQEEDQSHMHVTIERKNIMRYTAACYQIPDPSRSGLCSGSGSLRENAEQDRELFLEERSRTQNRREWFISYKELLERQAGILEAPVSLYDCFPAEALDRLFRVVQAEIGDEYSFDQKCNVASVIFNRVDHDEFGNTLEEVLTADQFATISNGRYLRAEVSEETILACEYSFMLGDTTGGCLFFDSNRSLKYSYAFNDGAHNFYMLRSE